MILTLYERAYIDIVHTLGTLNSGQARLLFSSGQVEYIRYWLHAMGLTKEPLPLPSSDYLLATADLRDVSKAIYKTEKDIKDALKVRITFIFLLLTPLTFYRRMLIKTIESSRERIPSLYLCVRDSNVPETVGLRIAALGLR